MYRRDNDGLEFDRIAFFTDAVYAIAMTLLIVAIAVPAVHPSDSNRAMLDALNDKRDEFVAFFIGFAVLGNYWFANHRFVSRLKQTNSRLMGWSLVYLAFVAWLPFPTAVLGNYGKNAIAVCLFAVSAAVVSALETVMFRQATRDKLFRNDIAPDVYRFAVAASIEPVVFFLISIPVAFLNTYVAIALWIIAGPAGALLNRWMPAGFETAFD
jgi:uncharacterized membrane protein